MKDKRTYADRREELIRAVAKRRRKIKTLAIEYRGGQCQICGYNKYQGALDLHHINGKKEFGIADKGYTRSWKKIKAELDKCILVCANCHREIEGGITQLSREIGIEKRGEIGETPLFEGNPEPSLAKSGKGVETISKESTPSISHKQGGSASHPT
ncbi:MAG: HNH endonuclease signature motif containing protein [bacterium]|nr:HNH endonuclease signature motif containing protein [bacterium]